MTRLAIIGAKAPAPVYERNGVRLYLGDCIDVLPHLTEQVDLTITSPPYNIGKEHEDNLPLDEYLDWSEQWLTAVYDTTAPDGALWLNVGYLPVPNRGRAVPLPYLLWDRCHGRRFVGVEKRADYLDFAIERVEAEFGKRPSQEAA